MAWYRAAFMAVLTHGILLAGLFTFTLKGSPWMYKTDIVFWGSILQARDVSPRGAGMVPLPVAVDAGAGIWTADTAGGWRLWRRGIQVDKPESFQNALPSGDEHILRFTGERVDLDAPDDGGNMKMDDVVPFPVKLRLERP